MLVIHIKPNNPAATYFFDSVNITYIDRNGNRIKVKGKVGDNLLYLAHRYGIEMEGKLHMLQPCKLISYQLETAHELTAIQLVHFVLELVKS